MGDFKLKLQHDETGRIMEVGPDERDVIQVPHGYDVVWGQSVPDGIRVQGVTTLAEIFGESSNEA